jgi:membrane-bound lytic murein transglycosylase F
MYTRSHLVKILLFSLIIFSVFFISCNNIIEGESKAVVIVDDLEQIQERGKLLVVTDFNSINYYIYEGSPMGYQYELLQELSDHLGLRLEVKVNNDHQQNFESLAKGECDLIASNLTITQSGNENIEFTLPHNQSRQVLVQRIPQKKNHSLNRQAELITNLRELGGKTVYVHRGSVFANTLQSLSEEIGERIKVAEVPVSSEQLIKLVARGDIDYTIADENIAVVNKKYFPQINIETAVSLPQSQAWAVNKGAVILKEEINAWQEEFMKTRKYAFIYHKYYKSPQSVKIVNSKFYYPETGQISFYDKIIKQESARIGWDWRLLASLVYQESRFNPDAVSHAGAFGLMQLMPQTAQRFGVNEESSPEEHIRAGVRFIEYLDKRLSADVQDPDERKKFILASYNAGLGHVLDAMRLAVKYGKDPGIWEDHVEYCLMKKSDPLYYNDEVVKSGYLRGTETFNFVRKIMYRYNHYLNIEHVDLAQLLSQDQ